MKINFKKTKQGLTIYVGKVLSNPKNIDKLVEKIKKYQNETDIQTIDDGGEKGGDHPPKPNG